jgi:phage shock protein C
MKKLYRSAVDRKIAGICGGLGEYFSVDPTLIRLAFVLVALITAIIPMIAAYLIGWIIIPEARSTGA